jgi:dGTPase
MERATSTGQETERTRRWASTMAGHGRGLRTAHADSHAVVGPGPSTGLGRQAREEAEHDRLAAGATRAEGAGRRERPEEPDLWRTCFERDRDRILHSSAFRRLAGKTQVFVFPADHQRTRLTHALEVAQVARSIASACGLNTALTEAIALGHDCGHGPGGHASEDALGVFLPDGFDHAVWGASVSLAELNLCAETIDGVRNHSWSRPAPATPEGEVVSWADRIAYVCHDWEDAVSAGIVAPGLLPAAVRSLCGEDRSAQLRALIAAMVDGTLTTGRVGMDEERADALAAFRRCNYDHVYLRAASRAQAEAVIPMLRALVEYFADRPHHITGAPSVGVVAGGTEEALRLAVGYVAGMTDRFAMANALSLLGWDPERLPAGIGEDGPEPARATMAPWTPRPGSAPASTTPPTREPTSAGPSSNS